MAAADRHLYEVIADALRESIESGVYPVDAQLPSEAELQRQHSASPATVRRALQVLQEAGLTRAERAKGVFVRGYDRTIVDTSLAGGSREVGAAVDVRTMVTPAHVAEHLPGVTEVVRRRVLGGAVKDSFYPRETVGLVPALGSPVPVVEPPDYILLADAGIMLGVGEQIVDVVSRMPTREEAALLGLGAGTPVLEQTTALIDATGRPRVVRVCLYAGDRHQLRFKLRG